MKSHLTTLYWLCKREYWESRQALVLLPLLIAGLCLALVVAWLAMHAPELRDPDLETYASLEEGMTFLMVATMIMIIGYTAFSFVSYALQALHQERADQSILFWHSLPVSDAHVVFAKGITALLVIPTIGTAIALLANGVAALGVAYLLPPDIAWGAAERIFLWEYFRIFPLQILAAIPMVSWLLLVGAIVRRRPLLWSLSVPAAYYAGIMILGAFGWEGHPPTMLNYIVLSLIAGVIPGWFADLGIDLEGVGLEHAYQMLFDPNFVAIVVMGIVLFVAAIRARSKSIAV